VFFDTADALVPRVSAGVLRVYEWHDGTISLITSPQDPNDSFYLGSSANGGDVFFGTHAQLVTQDTDSSGDLYDARIGGGFPASAAGAPCIGDACLGAASTHSAMLSPATAAFAGPANSSAAGPSPAVSRSKVMRMAVRRRRFVVTVRVGGAGRVTVTGAGLVRLTRMVPRAGTYRLRATLTAAARGRLRRTHKLGMTLHVTFTPTRSGN